MAVLKRQSDKVDVLNAVPLFKGLSKRDLTDIARQVDEVEFRPGEIMVAAGESGREAFVVLDGTATVRKNDRKVAELGTGAVVGEMSLLTDLPRNATVRAETFVPALRIQRSAFLSMLEDHPAVAVKIVQALATRLAQNGGNI